MASRRYWWRIAVAVTAVVFLVIGVRSLLHQGDLLALPAVVLVLLVWLLLMLEWLVTWLLTEAGPPVLARARRLALAAWSGLAGEPEGRWLVVRARQFRERVGPIRPVWRWLAGRLAPDRRGLGVTLPALVLAGVTVALVALDRALRAAPATVPQIDHRYADLATNLHTVSVHRLMVALSAVGATTGIIVVLVVLIGGAVAARAGTGAILLVATSVVSSVTVTVLKAAVGRTRPAVGTLVETSKSWPSGHAAGGLALAGGICLLLVWAGVRRWRWIAAAVVPVGLLIGYGRAYLTVHWLSDVAAGWLVAIGATALVVLTANLAASHRPARPAPGRRRGWLVVAAVVAVAVASVRGVTGAGRTFPPRPATPLAHLATDGPLIVSVTKDPFSRTLLGRAMEPISVVIAADRPTLLAAIRQAGWAVADRATLPRLWATYRAGAAGRPDPTAPVTPTFLHTSMQDLAIQQQLPGRGVRARHHARLWHLPVLLADGCQVWAATASLDDRVEWNWHTLVPNHHIAPAVDVERAHVADTLTATGLLTSAGSRQLVPPTLGHNAAGDPFFTDGRAVILHQHDTCRPPGS